SRSPPRSQPRKGGPDVSGYPWFVGARYCSGASTVVLVPAGSRGHSPESGPLRRAGDAQRKRARPRRTVFTQGATPGVMNRLVADEVLSSATLLLWWYGDGRHTWHGSRRGARGLRYRGPLFVLRNERFDSLGHEIGDYRTHQGEYDDPHSENDL